MLNLAKCVAVGILIFGIAVVSRAAPIVIDFETEDDGTTPLSAGQIVDDRVDPSNTEFGTYFNLSSEASSSHLGLTIFDSDQPSDFDADLVTQTGNILIVQSPESPSQSIAYSTGALYETPNDAGLYLDGEDDFRVRFDFLQPVELLSIALIDIDTVAVRLTLLDSDGFARVFEVPEGWTGDRVKMPDTNGIQSLDLTTLLPQAAEANAGDTPATATQDALFDEEDVRFLLIDYQGHGPSAGLDNLEFNLIPEPSSALLILAGALGMTGRGRRRTR